MRAPKVVQQYKSDGYDTHLLANGDLIDLKLQPFRGADVTHVDIISTIGEKACNGRALVGRELIVSGGGLACEFTITLEMDNKQIRHKFVGPDKQWHRPDKRFIFRKVLDMIYG